MPSNVEVEQQDIVIYEDEESYYDDDNPVCGLCGKYYCPCCGCDCWMSDEEE